MPNDTTGEDLACKGFYPAYEISGLVPALFVLHALTIIVFLTHARILYHKVDIGHPVFAVIFQELIFLPLCELIGLILLVLSACLEDEGVLMSYFFVGRIAWLFHPLTWVVVTYLRHYLILKAKFDETQDIERLRKKSIIAVWLTFVPFVILAQASANVILRIHGWPKVMTKDMSQGALIWALVTGRIMANIPDVISICLYVVLWKHFKTVRVTPVETTDAVEDDSNQNEIENYGGIWVGEISEPSSSEHDCHPETHPDNIPENLSENDNGHHSDQAVLQALRWHLGLAMLDILFSFKSFFPCSVPKVVLVYILRVIFIYWIPLIVIANGFQQLKGLWKLFCFKLKFNLLFPLI